MPVLLISASNRDEDSQFSEKVSKACGFDFMRIESAPALNAVLVERPQCILFWDIDTDSSGNRSDPLSLDRMLPVVSKQFKPKHVFGLASKSVFEINEANRITSIGHYCVRNYSPFAEKWISKLCFPLFSPEPFGLEFYKDDATPIKRIEIKGSREKSAAVEAIGNVLVKKGVFARAVQMIIRSVDELLMNALFDAPVDAQGKRYRKETARDASFALVGRERVVITTAFGSDMIAIGVKDQFGSLETNEAFNALKRDFSSNDYKVNAQTKSAGLGLHGIAASGLSISIACKPGVATEAVIAFPIYTSYKETKTAFRSFSFNVR